MEGCGGSQEQGLGANTPTGLAARPNGLLPPGWVLGTGLGGEQKSLMVFLKTMRRSRPWGCWLLDLLLACRSDAKLHGQEINETPQRTVQGLERKPSTLATIGRSVGE